MKNLTIGELIDFVKGNTVNKVLDNLVYLDGVKINDVEKVRIAIDSIDSMIKGIIFAKKAIKEINKVTNANYIINIDIICEDDINYIKTNVQNFGSNKCLNIYIPSEKYIGDKNIDNTICTLKHIKEELLNLLNNLTSKKVKSKFINKFVNEYNN